MMTGRTVLIATEMLAASVWVGSLVCLALVSSVARRVLDGPSRVALFRGIGRLYGRVGTGALLVAIVAGLAIAGHPSHWETTVTVAVILSAVLVALTLVGMAQARRMTVERQRALDAPRDASIASAINRGAAVAGALRGSIALVTLIILTLGARAIGA
jgi:putative copper export protein